MRIAKYISNAGICSRRDAEKLILEGNVFINNNKCEKVNTNVSVNDKISVNNKIVILKEKIRLWKLYKPTKIICTNNDPQKRKTIFDIMPNNLPRLISIGRLDFMSEGLILLTNNGDFARKMELPSSNILRVYRLCIAGKINTKVLNKINNGIEIHNINYMKVKVKIEKVNNKYSWLIFKLKEGKNREIRNICKYFKWNIVKLIRIQFGKYKLSQQKPGELIEIKNLEIV